MNYLDILNDKKIIELYKKINKKINYVIDHGLLHTQHVVDNCLKICDALNFDDKSKNICAVSAALHDVGRLKDNNLHSKYGADFAKKYLKNNFDACIINKICEAISMHDNNLFNYSTKNKYAWVLFLADKIDNVRSRFIESLITEKDLNKPSYLTKQINIIRKEDSLIFTFEIYSKSNNLKILIKNYYLDLLERFCNHFKLRLKIKYKVAEN